ncbi:ABC transporter permease [Hephaestia mangrovi]|uniref:ABC transporter permease n=1 Tax=Hephaestia mangrovi TaxID=2873268 RepID=UPI001CA6CFB1|nr:ABC transporter permease [Hephaestia mangrovi]MBY8826828.1 ABC transporter permease [Hephaestia mangrovi]
MSSTLLTLYRSLTRHKLYALLSIGGLALGIAVFLVLFLYVQFERSYDKVLPGHDKIWAVSNTWHLPGAPETPYFSTMGALLDQLKGDFPQVNGTRFWTFSGATVVRGPNATNEMMALVDPNYFDLFPFSTIAGDPKAALRDPTSVVITKKMATKYFGASDAIGQPMTIVLDGKSFAYHVGAVIEDRPKNMSYTADLIAPLVPARLDAADTRYFSHWGSSQLQTFLSFDNAAEPKALEAQMPSFIDRHGVTDQGPDLHKMLSIGFTPLGDVHLFDPADKAVVATLGIVGALTLLIAIVNYINLATARAGLRAREVAIRKVMGGSRRALVRQFVGEAIATVALAALIGLALAEVALPLVNSTGGTSLAIDYWGGHSILPPLVILVVVVGLLAGAYPALMLSHYRPATVLASSRSPGGGRAGSRLRQTLVVLQFAIAIAFMIGTGVLVAQTQHLRNANLGFQREGMVVVPSFGDGSLDEAQRRELLTAFAALPGVTGVTHAMDAPGDDSVTNANNMHRPGDKGSPPSIVTVDVGPQFFQVYAARLLAGRFLDPSHALDDFTDVPEAALQRTAYNVVINQAAAARLGFASAQDAIGKIVIQGRERGGDGDPVRVVGVIDDVRFHSPHEPVRPTMYYFYRHDSWPQIAAIRFAGTNAQTLTAQLQRTWKQIAPAVPFKSQTVDQKLYDNYYKPDDQRSHLFTIGAVLAVLIGCIGLYGLASFDTARRVKEIGIRKTLGASTGDVLKLLIGQFLKPVLIANLIAWPLAYFAMRKWLSGFDDRIALSPLFFLAATLIALAIACATVFSQAWRVARAEPARALRYE